MKKSQNSILCAVVVLRSTWTKMRTIKKGDMTQVVWIDSRSRTSGSDSKFEIQLRETLHITEDTRIRVDKCTFIDSFLTTDAGKYIYFL